MMEEQKMTLESAGATKEIIDTLKSTHKIVQEAMKELYIESLEELKEELEETKAAQQEINNSSLIMPMNKWMKSKMI